MSGRAKGRARGRARGGTEAPTVPRPGGGAAQGPPQQPIVRASQRRDQNRGAQNRPGDQQPSDPARNYAQASDKAGGAQSNPVRSSASGALEKRQHVEPKPVPRPAGVPATPIRLLCNCFRVESSPDWVLYQYHVVFAPQIEAKPARHGLVRSLELLRPYRKLFDGAVLFMFHKLENQKTEIMAKRRDGTDVQITLTLTNELPPSDPVTNHVRNVMINRVSHLMEMVQVGRHYYSPQAKFEIPQHRLEVWPGFITAISQYETSIMLCVEPSFKIMRSDTVYDILKDIRKRANFRDAAVRRLLGEIVLTKYNNKTYRVDDIDWNQTAKSEFERSDGTKISFVEYYKQAYNAEIRDHNQPLLVSRPKKKDIRRGQQGNILLVPELCTVTGLSADMKADFRVKKDVDATTRLEPNSRHQAIMKYREQLQNNEAALKEVQDWGMKIAGEVVQIDARILGTEQLRMGTPRSFTYSTKDTSWGNELKGTPPRTKMPLHDWMLVYTGRDADNAEKFVGLFKKVGHPMGIEVRDPTRVRLDSPNNHSFLSGIRENMSQSIQFVVCILPSNRKDLYDAIKKLLCINLSVPSQVVLSRTMGHKAVMSVMTKIAIQINCKLGGEIWEVDIPLRNTMVIGIDTYHDSSQRGRSVGAFVASLNKPMTRYYSRTCFQEPGQEFLPGLLIMATAALKKFNSINGTLPDRIFIYRDGVGDGQIRNVMEFELPQIRDCFTKLAPDYKPKVTLFIVRKRINIRFFMPKGRGLENPPAGTVVDTDVTTPDWFDFYLVSQSVRQGTVNPTHYYVILDENQLGPGRTQLLTYKLTHLYYNWPGTIKVPAPCQYAHKLAFLVGQSLHEEPDIALADRLFFL